MMQSNNELVPVSREAKPTKQASVSELAARHISQEMPLLLVSLLERRYLSDFQATHWSIESPRDDRALPLLREITELGRPQSGEAWARAMPHVLAACHESGHALVMTVHGDGERHRVYLGGRRLAGTGARSTEDYLEGQAGAFQAFFTGLKLAPTQRLDSEEMPELSSLLSSAPAMAMVTGIPSGRGGLPLDGQSLDNLVRAVGPGRYALTIVAEPLEARLVDEALDACRRLKSEIHAQTRRTVTQSQGESASESRSETEGQESLNSKLPAVMFGVAIFSNLAGILVPGLGPAVQHLSGAAMQGGMFASQRAGQELRENSQQLTSGKTWSESGGTELLDANAEFCEKLLDAHIMRLQAARGGGWWRTAVYVAAENEAVLHRVTGALRGVSSGDVSALDPLRVVSVPEHLLRPAMRRGQTLALHPTGGAHASHPLGEAFDSLATPLNGEELAVFVNLPRREIPGLPMRTKSEFALSTPPPTEHSITLGTLHDEQGNALQKVTLSPESLNRHVFITGITGSGKTNTCMQLLLESHEKLGVPFLVIEPAKAEYHRLSQVEGLRDTLKVFSVGGSSHPTLPFRLNPLDWVDGIPLGRHIDLLKAVFNASFPMFAGMNYVLEEALLDVYTSRGWNLYTSENAALIGREGWNEKSALMPSLSDLHDQIEIVLSRKKYGQEIHQNMSAALRSRLKSLMVGNKGLMLNTRHSTPLEDLFEGPAVIELQNLGDDEEKAFVMALLLTRLYEYAEVRGQGRVSGTGSLTHLTLIEEAHRLLAAPRGGGGDGGDPRGKAVAMFTDMLAELRAYGEGFLIADQIPTKLAPEVLKNSNVKIVHRLVAPDDREAAGSCINLMPDQIRHLNTLRAGQALVHDERLGEAILTQIVPAKEARAPALTDEERRERESRIPVKARRHLWRNSACRACPSPCDFLNRVAGSSTPSGVDNAREAFFASLLLDDAEGAWKKWSRWNKLWHERAMAMRGAEGKEALGLTYCAASQGAYEWLGGIWAQRAKSRDRAELRAYGESGDGDPSLTPEERIERENAASALTDLLWWWCRKSGFGETSLNDEERALFEKARTPLLEHAGTNSPHDRAGCEACPARCRMVPFVEPLLGDVEARLKTTLKPAVPVGKRLEVVREAAALAQSQSPALAGRAADDPRRAEWDYCLVVNTDNFLLSASRTELLKMLKDESEAEVSAQNPVVEDSSANNELLAIFGRSS
ncbi:ATP-binding protein [bacterium]|nr:MAG: ATP-binding protein [bacterium]